MKLKECNALEGGMDLRIGKVLYERREGLRLGT